MRGGSDFKFESVELLNYHLYEISLKRGKSYIKSPEWIKNKRATINSKNNDDNCFQFATTVALNHQNIENHLERISNIKPFINQYNWKDMDIKAHQKDRKEFKQEDLKNLKAIDWKKFEQNNKTIALNILFLQHNTKTIRLAYKSKYNRKCKNQVVLLMISDGKKWHYLALKSVLTVDGYNRPVISLSRLLRGITSNNNGGFYCLSCLHSYRTDNVLRKHERLCDKHDYCHVKMPTEGNKVLNYNQGEKSLKAPFIIYLDLQCLLMQEESCQNNPEKSCTERKAKHETSSWEMFTKCSFDEIENKFDYCRGIDCIK